MNKIMKTLAMGLFVTLVFAAACIDFSPHQTMRHEALKLPPAPIATIQPTGARTFALLPLQETTRAPMLMNRACIALAVYVEAPHAGWLEQAVVANTVINSTRAHGSSSTCMAIRRKGFLPAIAWFKPSGPPWVKHPQRWMQAMSVADSVITHDYSFGTPGCTSTTRMWPADAPRPVWALHMRMTCQVGKHRFYSPTTHSSLPVVAVASPSP
jgi:hypothetical protein